MLVLCSMYLLHARMYYVLIDYPIDTMIFSKQCQGLSKVHISAAENLLCVFFLNKKRSTNILQFLDAFSYIWVCIFYVPNDSYIPMF